MTTVNSDQEFLTKEKYAELEKELHELQTIKRKEIADKLEFAKSLGDLSENAEYHEARTEQGEVEDRINRLEYILKHTEIITLHHTSAVDVGSTVSVSKKGEKTKVTYKIVGSEEADMAQGKISYKSPFGQAMMGKKKGDTFTFTAPKGEVTYTVISIE